MKLLAHQRGKGDSERVGPGGHLKAAWMIRADEVSRLPRAPSSCASCPARRNTRVLPICSRYQQ